MWRNQRYGWWDGWFGWGGEYDSGWRMKGDLTQILWLAALAGGYFLWDWYHAERVIETRPDGSALLASGELRVGEHVFPNFLPTSGCFDHGAWEKARRDRQYKVVTKILAEQGVHEYWTVLKATRRDGMDHIVITRQALNSDSAVSPEWQPAPVCLVASGEPE